MLKKTIDQCRVCQCTASTPCVNTDGASCRDFDPQIQDECLFCTKPSLKSPSKKEIRIVNKSVINKKYIYRIDRSRDHAYQVCIPIPELGRDVKNRTRCLRAWFDDRKMGGRSKSFLAAIKFRDEALQEYNLSLEPKIKEPDADVNIYWSEVKQHYLVKIKTRDVKISKIFSIKLWVSKDVAYQEAKRWRDTIRADLGLPAAPGAFNTTVVQFEERKQEIIEQRTSLIRASVSEAIEKQKELDREQQRVKPNHNGISRSKARLQAQRDQDTWYETVREHGLQSSAHVTRGRKYSKRR